MDNAPDSGPDETGPAKKPTPAAKPRTTTARKPAAPRKPAARKPAAKTPAAPKPAPAKAADVDVDIVEPEVDDETVLAPRDAEIDDATVLAPRTGELAVDEPAEVVEEPEPEVEEAVVEAEPDPVAETPAAEEAPSASSPVGLGARVRAWARGGAAASATLTEEPAEKRVVDAGAVERLAGGAVVIPAGTPVLSVSDLTKSFDDTLAVSGLDLVVEAGAFYGIVGPNGAGKTTTLSMITGLLRPDSGRVVVNGSDVWTDAVQAKRMMGVLPDRLRLFDRLTGGQLLYYAGVLRGLDGKVVRERTADLAHAFGLEESLGRLVSDYSAGMTKKIALAAAMIHSPRLLVLDEPFESVDPVSAATVTEILKKYVAAGGTVLLSSHSMDLVQRICDHVAVIVGGEILANGTMTEVRDGQTLEERFVDLAGGRSSVEGLEWLHTFSA